MTAAEPSDVTRVRGLVDRAQLLMYESRAGGYYLVGSSSRRPIAGSPDGGLPLAEIERLVEDAWP